MAPAGDRACLQLRDQRHVVGGREKVRDTNRGPRGLLRFFNLQYFTILSIVTIHSMSSRKVVVLWVLCGSNYHVAFTNIVWLDMQAPQLLEGAPLTRVIRGDYNVMPPVSRFFQRVH